MRARELTYRSKQTKEGGEVGSDDGPLLIAKEEMFSGPSEAFKDAITQPGVLMCRFGIAQRAE